jgi:hypothetical protein
MIRIPLPLILLTTACAPVKPMPVEHGAGHCNMDAAKPLIGEKMSDKTGQKARALAGAGMVRWVRPGQAVTMDYREDRLNIMLDDKDRITRLSCG